jgi:hypothetical protein
MCTCRMNANSLPHLLHSFGHSPNCRIYSELALQWFMSSLLVPHVERNQDTDGRQLRIFDMRTLKVRYAAQVSS